MAKELPYWQQRQAMKLGTTKKPEAVNREKKESLAAWYETQDTQAPDRCENCGNNLTTTINFHPRAHICHIVPKGKDGCPSVATHPLNRWFGCLTCHTFYDKEAAEIVATMKIIPVLRQRVKIFYREISENETRRVPPYLRPPVDLPEKYKFLLDGSDK